MKPRPAKDTPIMRRSRAVIWVFLSWASPYSFPKINIRIPPNDKANATVSLMDRPSLNSKYERAATKIGVVLLIKDTSVKLTFETA